MSRMLSRSSPISPSSRRLTGRTPLSLISSSTTFSHVDCIRSISNGSIFIAVFSDIKVFYSQSCKVANRQSSAVLPIPGTDLHSPLPLVLRMLQFTQLLTLPARIHQQQVRPA